MAVTVDHTPLRTEEMGLRTVGQVLAHLKKENRLVVHVLIDGLEPDLKQLPEVRRSPLSGHTVFIETTDPREMAMEILNDVQAQLEEADRLKNEAADLLQKNQNVKAMERLAGCFTTWHNAQQSFTGTAQLMNIDLAKVVVGTRPLTELLADFTEQLKQIKLSLENRDFVTLSDLLIYETTQTTGQWSEALRTLRGAILPLH
ncbi:MAG: hypothetical protein M3O30_03925 [Planctomycetota bacterium]|nr:hypothetical protein [Planctomycetota bacterium]